MIKGILQLCILPILLIGFAGKGEALLLYDNGPPAWSGALAFGYGTMDVVADDFVLNVDGTINSAAVDTWA